MKPAVGHAKWLVAALAIRRSHSQRYARPLHVTTKSWSDRELRPDQGKLAVIGTFIPLVSALVGGLFLLLNRRGRRIERLKNLVEVSKNLPIFIPSADTSVQRAILKELGGIELSVTPWFQRLREYLWVALPIQLTALIAACFIVVTVDNQALIWTVTAIDVLMAIGLRIYPTCTLRKNLRGFLEPYAFRSDALDTMLERELKLITGSGNQTDTADETESKLAE